ncbi:type II toxin-antitoxin system VapC family toxin [Hoeflea sp.]|uniref:type II toxin-antitoxin system VapC family toxin n=1 Tax=Hoeflea sp. TaxID=1940281 RepID=UPI0025BE7928|nr:type II toxin-antitoxin system VapC family toxin [Hoeflea sp.]MBU4531027.1 type II toxin-antitoxin system VapC family toxin [Alphaproteobacteria bacterium]MBU4542802.1 type II toxin-antitoxin system VapC family toxin [Alphaproteobacteria bacterium]MBU4552614.1 type II toxin-antitoxin system VapC family toxin [Alphaproteobacteria bacterium]MBV1781491.1 type II toxin-antitoxin system VapC family toxin [Hoeflea sp.]
MAEARRVYLDTNALIAVLEKVGELDGAQTAFVGDIDTGVLEAVTSELTLAECLVKPIADKDEPLIRAYLSLLSADSEIVRVSEVSRAVLLKAARVRAGTGVRLPDAIHIATATLSRCDAFVSNDRRLASASTMDFKLWSEMGHP